MDMKKLREEARTTLAREVALAILRVRPAREAEGAPIVSLDSIRASLARRGVAVSPRELGHALRRMGVPTRRFGSGSTGSRLRGVLLTEALRSQLTDGPANQYLRATCVRATVRVSA
jgi:hypothetical protein